MKKEGEKQGEAHDDEDQDPGNPEDRLLGRLRREGPAKLLLEKVPWAVLAVGAGVMAFTAQHPIAAMRTLLTRCKLVVEPAGAAALAALLSGKVEPPARNIAVVVSGGNLDLDRLAAWMGPDVRR